MFNSKFNCNFINLIPLYRASDRDCPPSEWKVLVYVKRDLKHLAAKLECEVDDILAPKGRGATSSFWVHPAVHKLWQAWADKRPLKTQHISKQEIIPVEVEVLPLTDEEELPETTWQPNQIEALAKSDEQYPFDFDDVWIWIGYSSKQTAEKTLCSNFEQPIDFSILGLKSSIGGRPAKDIRLTADCFEHFCLMAGTEQGKAVRKYFIQCRRELKQLKSQPQPQPTQTNADPFIAMIEEDLNSVSVAKPFIIGWKYDSLKALHPDRAQMFDSAKELLMGACAEAESPVNVTTISQVIDSRYKLKIMPEYLNKIWVQMGLQVRGSTSKCRWVLTEKGKEYGRAVPYGPNQTSNHQGYQVLWLTSVVDLTYDYLKSQQQG